MRDLFSCHFFLVKNKNLFHSFFLLLCIGDYSAIPRGFRAQPSFLAFFFFFFFFFLSSLFFFFFLFFMEIRQPTDGALLEAKEKKKRCTASVPSFSLSLSLSLGAVESLTKQHIICMTIKKDTADNNDRQRRRRAPPARHDETSENSRRNKRIMNGIDTHTHAHTHTLADDGTNLQEFFSFSEPNNFYNALRRCCAIN